MNAKTAAMTSLAGASTSLVAVKTSARIAIHATPAT